MTLEVRCPAKINTFLSVGPPDETGYHPIRTIMQTISICDTLILETSLTDEFFCDFAEVPKDNTVTKAWRLAKEYVELPRLRVRLIKAGFTQAGLGLGSSDAAGLLRGLILLTRENFGKREAFEVASAVGSDVPFFLLGGLARAEGYGEVLTPCPDSNTMVLVIAKPQIGVSTPEAYRALDSLPRPFLDFPGCNQQFNDFESVMPSECRQLCETFLALGATEAHLCGSGSAVYGSFDSPEVAKEAALILARDSTLKVAQAQSITRQESLEIGECSAGVNWTQ